ncbi:hypothetical protein CIPAW_06G004200 [Carya illinoinensis]|uniref:Uncharacterized protein n=1 Tax=Carya illinoinensis TaxID=32201 RepID=A0A8T1Q6S4_CARIL|nr:hypothetical protein CIPAW_06G004200 [Carya illinoinensis]
MTLRTAKGICLYSYLLYKNLTVQNLTRWDQPYLFVINLYNIDQMAKLGCRHNAGTSTETKEASIHARNMTGKTMDNGSPFTPFFKSLLPSYFMVGEGVCIPGLNIHNHLQKQLSH